MDPRQMSAMNATQNDVSSTQLRPSVKPTLKTKPTSELIDMKHQFQAWTKNHNEIKHPLRALVLKTTLGDKPKA